jgi:predicted O-methyltransferase YrrM
LLDQQWKFKQEEALLNIFSVLRPQILLPSMTDHAVAPDLAVIIIDKLQRKDIQFIVELGSGASSILVGLYLKQRGYGRLVSLEHDKVYADKIKQDVQRHEVQDFVEIRYASLLPVSISNVTYSWYDPLALEDLHSIDLLFVDGPPKTVSKFARYPAIPLLVKRLDKEAIVLLDDSKRDDERKIAKRWEQEFNMNCVYHDTEKGVTELSFNLDEQG